MPTVVNLGVKSNLLISQGNGMIQKVVGHSEGLTKLYFLTKSVGKNVQARLVKAVIQRSDN